MVKIQSGAVQLLRRSNVALRSITYFFRRIIAASCIRARSDHPPNSHLRSMMSSQVRRIRLSRETYAMLFPLFVIFSLFLTTLSLPSQPKIQKKNYLDKRAEYLTRIEQSINKKNTLLADTTYFKQIGQWSWGTCLAVDARDEYLFMGNGQNFQVLDVSNPSAPELIFDQYVKNNIISLKLHGNYAYIAIGTGLVIYNISNPRMPYEVSRLDVYPSASYIAVSDSFVYVTSFFRKTIRVIDVSNPRYPTLRGAITPNYERAYSIAERQKHLYLGDAVNGGIYVIDATNPDHPRVDTSFITGVSITHLLVQDTLLFEGLGEYNESLAVRIFSISNPSSLVELGRVQLPINAYLQADWVGSLSYDGHYLFVGTERSGMFSIDVSYPQSPRIIGGSSQMLCNELFYEASICMSGYIFSSTGSGMQIMDARVPAHLLEIAYIPVPSVMKKIAIDSHYVYVAADESGVWILDASTTVNVLPLSSINKGHTDDLLIDGKYLYFVNAKDGGCADSAAGLWSVDISDARNPVILSHYRGFIRDINMILPLHLTKEGDFIFISQGWELEGDSIVEIIDVTAPSNPKHVGIFAGQYLPSDIAVQNSFIFLGATDGVKVIDATNPSTPIEVTNFLSSITGLTIHDSLLFVKTGDSLYIYNIKNPLTPEFVGKTPTSHGISSSADLVVANTRSLLWTNGSLFAVDISDPRHPVQTAQFFSDIGQGVAARDDTIFCADIIKGLWILRLSDKHFTSMTLNAGWNLFSLPIATADNDLSLLFPGAASPAYAYNHGYQSTQELVHGKGYWIKLNEQQIFSIDGDSLWIDTIDVAKGWNMIGALSDSLPIERITSLPDSIIRSSFFRYDGAYIPAEMLIPSKGYWVKVSQDGKLILNSGNKR